MECGGTHLQSLLLIELYYSAVTALSQRWCGPALVGSAPHARFASSRLAAPRGLARRTQPVPLLLAFMILLACLSWALLADMYAILWLGGCVPFM